MGLEERCAPHGDHVIVHLLQLGLGGVHVVGGWVELVGLEGFIAQDDLEGLVVLGGDFLSLGVR